MTKIDLYFYQYDYDLDVKVTEKFSDYRIKRILKSLTDEEKTRHIQTEHILINVLEKYLNKIDKLSFDVLEHGKLKLSNSKLHFSIAHSNLYLVIAISMNEVGIDIEKILEKRIKIAKKLYDYEVNNYKKVIKDWTIIESYVKLNGKSMLANLKKVNILDEKNISGQWGNAFYLSNTFLDYYYAISSKTEFYTKEYEVKVLKDLITFEKCNRINQSNE